LDWRDHVTFNPGLKRPSDIDISYGHAEKAEKMLGWKPKVQLPELISRMVGEEKC
jgi:GDPmannose 4,6-dehydratase